MNQDSQNESLHKKCSELQFFLVRIFPYLDWIQNNFPDSGQIQGNMDQKHFEFGHFSHSEYNRKNFIYFKFLFKKGCWDSLIS